MLYDIIHVEDDPRFSKPTKAAADSCGLSILELVSLEELEKELSTNDARYYVVDGRFPRIRGGQVLELANEAIIKIREKKSDAKIIIYSSSMPNLKESSGLEGVPKSVMPKQLVAKIQNRINATY